MIISEQMQIHEVMQVLKISRSLFEILNHRVTTLMCDCKILVRIDRTTIVATGHVLWAQNISKCSLFTAGVPPRTSLGEITALSPPAGFKKREWDGRMVEEDQSGWRGRKGGKGREKKGEERNGMAGFCSLFLVRKFADTHGPPSLYGF